MLAVRDVTDDSLVVTSEEIFVPENTHDTAEEPLTSRIYLLDRADGDATEFGSAGGVRAATAVEGRPYVLSTDELVAFGPDGVRWRRLLAGEGVGLWSHGDRLLAIASDGDRCRVAGFSTDGERRWGMRAPDAQSADTLFADGTFYVGGGSGVLAIRPDGTVAWRDGRPAGWFIHDDATDRVYSRSGASADAATAYTAGGTHHWTFDPPSNNAWPTTATDDAVLVIAITGDHASESFYTIYAVDPESGEGSALVGLDTVFSVDSVGDTAYLAVGDEVHAYAPSSGE